MGCGDFALYISLANSIHLFADTYTQDRLSNPGAPTKDNTKPTPYPVPRSALDPGPAMSTCSHPPL